MDLLQNGMKVEQNQKKGATIMVNKMESGYGTGKVE